MKITDEMVDAQLNDIMDQAQVFASTYALAGGQFDDGTKFKQSKLEKDELRAMIRLALEAAAADVTEPAPEAAKDDRLGWLNAHTNLDLTWGEIDGWEDDCQWRIHREWTLLGYGQTVEQAIDAARAVLNADGNQ